MNLSHRYKIISQIGFGGMGKILRALDLNLDKEVAIKVLNRDTVGTDPRSIQRFQREAKAAGKLSHDSLVTILDFGITDDGEPYIVMEYIEGSTLKEFIESTELDASTVIELFKKLADAMSHAHRHGVIHRDLKSTNIIVTSDKDFSPSVKVVDFGIAKLNFDDEEQSKLTKTNAIIGSPIYMSPEQAAGLEVDERSDIYSLACLIFECLAGYPPFKGETAIDTIQLHKEGEVPLISKSKSGESVPSDLSKLIWQCMSKEVKNRPESMQVIWDKLEDISNQFECEDELSMSSEPKRSTNLLKKLVIGFVTISFLGLTIYLLSWNQEERIVSRSRFLQFDGDVSESKLVADRVLRDRDLKGIGNGEPFTEVKLDDSNLRGEGLRYLINTGVKKISLNRNFLNDSAFENLAKIDTITALSFDDLKRDLKASQIDQLKSLENLSNLKLRENKLSDQILKSISGFRALENLCLDKCKNLSPDGLKLLAGCKNLDNLSLSGTNLDRSHFKALLALKALRHLDLSDVVTFSCKDLETLVSSKTLKTININECFQLDSNELEVMKKSHPNIQFVGNPGTSSKKFTITSSKFEYDNDEQAGLNAVSKSFTTVNRDVHTLRGKSIIQLDITNSNINNEALHEICQFKLIELIISGSKITGDGFAEIAKVKTLRKLEANGIDLSSDHIKSLFTLPELKCVTFNSCRLDDRVFPALAKIGSLQEIYLRRNSKIRGTNLNVLEKLKNLEKLSFNRINIDYKNFAQLKNTSVTKLELDSTNLGDSQVKYLAHLNKINRIHANSNPLTDEGLMDLAKIRSLSALILSDCPNITDSGIKKFTKLRPDCNLGTN